MFFSSLSQFKVDLIGDWSATSLGPIPDRSATSCIKSQRVADQLQNLVATS